MSLKSWLSLETLLEQVKVIEDLLTPWFFEFTERYPLRILIIQDLENLLKKIGVRTSMIVLWPIRLHQ